LDGWGSRRGKLNLVNSETLTLALSPSPSCLLALEYIHKLPLTLLYYSYRLAQETRLLRRRRPGSIDAGDQALETKEIML
jgi:hypothetical protein